MTMQAPIPQPINYQTSAEVRATGELREEDSQRAIKEILLRRLIEGSIRDNERFGVATGVAVVDLSTNRTLTSHNQDTEQFAASINKLPVSLLVLEDLRSGKLSLDTILNWTAEDRRGGFGVYDQPDSPLAATLGEVLYDMLNKSGNTAVRILVNNGLGGAAAVNERLAQKPELAHTRLQPLDANRFFLGNSTPHDSMWTAGKLMEQQDRYARFMRDAMATNIFEDFGVRSQLNDSNYVILINKIGLLDDVDGNNRHDVGVIYNKKTGKSYAYSFMTTAPYNETDPTATNRAEQSLKEMGRTTLRYAGANRFNNHSGGEWRKHVEERIQY